MQDICDWNHGFPHRSIGFATTHYCCRYSKAQLIRMYSRKRNQFSTWESGASWVTTPNMAARSSATFLVPFGNEVTAWHRKCHGYLDIIIASTPCSFQVSEIRQMLRWSEPHRLGCCISPSSPHFLVHLASFLRERGVFQAMKQDLNVAKNHQLPSIAFSTMLVSHTHSAFQSYEVHSCAANHKSLYGKTNSQRIRGAPTLTPGTGGPQVL